MTCIDESKLLKDDTRMIKRSRYVASNSLREIEGIRVEITQITDNSLWRNRVPINRKKKPYK